MYIIKLIFIHFKRNILPVIAAILALTVAFSAVNVFYSTVKRTFNLCIFAKGFSSDELYAVRKNEPCEDYFMTPEKQARFYGQWEKGYALEQNIELPKDFDENSYNTETEIYELLSMRDAVRWLNQHDYDHEKEIFTDTTFEERINSSVNYNNIRKLGEILKDNNLSDEIYTRESIYFDNTLVDRYYFHYFSILDKNLSDMLNFKSSKGKDLCKTENNGDVIEAIAVGEKNMPYKLSLGNEFDVKLYNYQTNQYETKKVKIVGIMASPYYDLNITVTQSGEESYDLDCFIGRTIIENGASEAGLYILPFDGYDRYSYLGNLMSGNYYIKIPSGTDIDSLNEKLLDEGYNLSKMSDAYDNSYSQSLSYVLSNIVYIVVSMLTALVSACSALTVLTFNDRYLFETYFFCGCKNKFFPLITSGISVAVLLAAQIFCTAALKIYERIMIDIETEYFAISFDNDNILLTVLFGILIFFVNFILSLILFSDKRRKKHETV